MNIQTVRNIDELRYFPTPIPVPSPPPATQPDNLMVYVDGYYEPGDGGGGIFMYDHWSTTPEDLGIHFISKKGNGRWIRQYDGHINVMYFGVTKMPDNSAPPYNGARIQKAIDYAYDAQFLPAPPPYHGDLTVYFPAGTYWIDRTIIFRNKTHIKGDNGTQLWMQFQHDAEGKLIEYMFVMDKGELGRVIIENLLLDLGAYRSNAPYITVGGFLLNAQVSPQNAPGGLGSMGVFKDIRIQNAGGHGIRLRGSDGPKDPNPRIRINQYIYFDNIWIERLSETKNCVKMTGEQCNISFMSCQFSIPYMGTGSERDNGINVYIESEDSLPPQINSQIIFLGCANGGSPGKSVLHAYWIKHVENLSIENGWIEDTEIAIQIIESKDINILNNRFANAARGASNPTLLNQGDCIRSEGSIVNVERNFVIAYPIVDTERFVRGIGYNNTINLRNNSFHHQRLSETFGITQYTKVREIKTHYTSGIPCIDGIETEGKKLVLVLKGDLGETNIYRINSTIGTAETLYIRAEDTELTLHAWNATGETSGHNIYLSGLSSLILNAGEGALFTKTDGINGQEKCSYQLVSKY